MPPSALLRLDQAERKQNQNEAVTCVYLPPGPHDRFYRHFSNFDWERSQTDSENSSWRQTKKSWFPRWANEGAHALPPALGAEIGRAIPGALVESTLLATLQPGFSPSNLMVLPTLWLISSWACKKIHTVIVLRTRLLLHGLYAHCRAESLCNNYNPSVMTKLPNISS